MTTKDYLDEYGRLYYCYTDDISKGVDYQHAVERMQEIAQELEKLIIEEYEKNNK